MVELSELIYFKTGAMSFHDKEIPPEVLEQILKASTSSAWLGRWRLLSVTDKERRFEVVEAWQVALRKMGRLKDAEFVERWKVASLFIAFCQPKNFQPFGWVPAEYARIYAIQEVGAAVRSVELKGLEQGVGLHGIMGLLVPAIGDSVKAVLGIPEDQELVFFGIMGYPNEEVEQKFPSLEEVSYSEGWKSP
jgi:nitroreductase